MTITKAVSLATALVLALPLAARADKIGYVDTPRVVSELDDAKAAMARLEGELQAKQKSLEGQKAAFEKEAADLEKKRAVLAPEAFNKAQTALGNKLQGLQRQLMEGQKDLMQKQERAQRELAARLDPVIQEVATAEGFTYIFERAALKFAPAGNDITTQVIRRYNSKYPRGAAAPRK